MQLNENAIDLLKKRYFSKELNETTWEQLSKRIALSIADAEETETQKKYWQDEFYDLIYNLKFIPSTPCLINANKENPGQLSSCFIIELRDSIESIYSANSQCAKIFQKNGGVGFDISVLRPRNSAVETSKGYTIGPVGFMEIFDLTAKKVTENNMRKGAIKIDLGVFHPDIYEFIHCKDDITKLNNMNISVGINDAFMRAVESNEMWQLRFPDFSWNKEIYNKEWDGDIEEWESKGYPVTVYKEIKAKDLYKEIMESAWRTGEPGISFVDTMNRANPNPHLGKARSTNPCLHRDTLMVTDQGLKKIKDCRSVSIWNGKEFSKSEAWMTGIKDVVLTKTNNGFEYITTPDHKFLLNNGEWCEAKGLLGKRIAFDLSEKEWKGYNPYPNVDYNILGFEFGNGIYHLASGRMKYVYVTSNLDDQVIEMIENEFNDKFYHYNNKLMINIPYGTIYADAFVGDIDSRIIPDWIMALPKKEMADFIRGLMSANGCNFEKYRKLVSINKKVLQQVQQMLLLFGIKSKLWTHNEKQDIKFLNDTYTCKENYHLVLSKSSYLKYLNKIGLIQGYKNEVLEDNFKQEENYETVVSVEILGKAEVWDFTEPNLHRGITNGAIVHNCSEFSSIPHNSCNLGSINLANCGNTKHEVINEVRERVRVSVRFLDNMITVNKLPLEKIENVTKTVRSIGLGVMGFADMLYNLNIRYNSQEAYDFTRKLFETIRDAALGTSIALAEEKGVYDAWPNSIWAKKGIKVRNSNFLSIAPTGSISFIAGTSGGIEPNYALVYTRRTNEDDLYYITNPIFKKVLKDRDLYSDELLEKIVNNNGSCQGIPEIPEDIQKVFVTAYDITPKEHIDMVSIIQNYVDLSISKTVNLPEEATVNDIMDLYAYSWEQGLKGVTVYRNNCRKNQVLSVGKVEKPKPKITEAGYVDVEPAMKVAYGKRIKVKTGCGALWLFFFVNEEGELAEIWSQVSGGGCKANIESISRLTSLAFRAKIDPKLILDQLSSAFCKNSMDKVRSKSCAHIIAREIEKFLKENQTIIAVSREKVDNKQSVIDEVRNPCPDCGSQLASAEGCIKCNNCGYSKC